MSAVQWQARAAGVLGATEVAWGPAARLCSPLPVVLGLSTPFSAQRLEASRLGGQEGAPGGSVLSPGPQAAAPARVSVASTRRRPCGPWARG